MSRDESPPTSSEAEREDLRVVRTRQSLGQALVELSLEQGFANVTIRELTDRARVGYATFFRHFQDKETLLRALLEDVLRELMGLLEPLSAEADPARTGTLVFRHAADHLDLYRLLLRSQTSLGLLPRIVAVGVAGVEATFRARPESGIPLAIAAHHIIRSFLALLEWWLEQGAPYPPETMGAIYRDLILLPTRQAALAPREGPAAASKERP